MGTLSRYEGENETSMVVTDNPFHKSVPHMHTFSNILILTFGDSHLRDIMHCSLRVVQKPAHADSGDMAIAEYQDPGF